MTVALIAVFGAVGSVARWALATIIQKSAGTFPAGTLVVNVLGSAVIGFVMAVFAARGQEDARLRIAITSGFLGGFTTMSAFAYETVALVEKKAPLAAALNVGLTLGSCLLACAGGLVLGRLLTR